MEGCEMFKEATLSVVLCFVAAFSFVTATIGAEEAVDIVVHIDSKTYEEGQIKETASKVYISGENVKVVQEGSRAYFIFRGEEDLVWLVDEEQEKYIQIDEELLNEIKSTIEQMKEQLENMPPQQREMVETMMKQRMRQHGLAVEEEDSLKYNHTDETKDINNYPCRKTELLKGSARIGDLWVTDWENIEHKEVLESAYTAMMDFVGSLSGVFEEGVYQEYIGELFVRRDVDGELEGMVISSVHYNDSDQPVAETTLNKIEPEDLPDKTFLPPENYQLEEPGLPE